MATIKKLHNSFDKYYHLCSNSVVDSIIQTPIDVCSHIVFYGPPSGLVLSYARYSIASRFRAAYPLKYSKQEVTVNNGSHPVDFEYRIYTGANFIEIDLSVHGNSDKNIFSEVIKPIVSQRSMNSECSRHIVIMRNIDRMSDMALLSLRRTMEIYAPTCLFIMTASQISRVPTPLQSRVWLVRCTLTCDQVYALHNALSPETISDVSKEERDIARSLFDKDAVWKTEIESIISSIRRVRTPWTALIQIKDMLTKVFPYMDSHTSLFRIVLGCYSKSPHISRIVEIMAEADGLIAKSHRPIFALEAAFMKMYTVGRSGFEQTGQSD